MSTAIATRTVENASSIDDEMEVLFGKLDETIDDISNWPSNNRISISWI